jgi:hypothetical protein
MVIGGYLLAANAVSIGFAIQAPQTSELSVFHAL